MSRASTKLTREEILAASTGNKGWTRKQLASWGVAWPPPKGWMERLIDGTHQQEPISCGSNCPADNISKAAIRAIMKAGGVDENEAVERLAAEYTPTPNLEGTSSGT